MLNSFVAIDVETASRRPVRICAVGAVRIEGGRETCAYYSLVRVEGRVRYTGIHGLTAADLLGAPDWPRAWRALLPVLRDITTIVAFRASFDRAAILAESGRHGVRLPPLHFACAAEMFKKRHGLDVSLRASLEHLGIPFPGQPHNALADARAAAALALACD